VREAHGACGGHGAPRRSLGNLVTSIRAEAFESFGAIACGSRGARLPFVGTLRELMPAQAARWFGGSGRLEIAVREGARRRRLRAATRHGRSSSVVLCRCGG